MAKSKLTFQVEVNYWDYDSKDNIEVEIPDDSVTEVTEYITHCQQTGQWDRFEFKDRFPQLVDMMDDEIDDTISDSIYVDDIENHYADFESDYDVFALHDIIFSDETQKMDIHERAEFYRDHDLDYDADPEYPNWSILFPSMKVDCRE